MGLLAVQRGAFGFCMFKVAKKEFTVFASSNVQCGIHNNICCYILQKRAFFLYEFVAL